MLGLRKTTVYLPVQLQGSLRALSAASGRPQAELIREALEQYITRQRAPLPKSIGVIQDSELDGRHVADWLDNEWHTL
jgi:predicted transcriptional regulator